MSYGFGIVVGLMTSRSSSDFGDVERLRTGFTDNR
jgi:hypothetical protein